MTAADYEFACKAGTAAIQTCMGLVKSGMIKYGLAIGSDVSQGAPAMRLNTPPQRVVRHSSSGGMIPLQPSTTPAHLRLIRQTSGDVPGRIIPSWRSVHRGAWLFQTC